jgi:hypothetical protein
MTPWQESVEIHVARTGVNRYKFLCSEQNPNVAQRDAYRRYVVEQVTGKPAPASSAARPCCGGFNPYGD